MFKALGIYSSKCRLCFHGVYRLVGQNAKSLWEDFLVVETCKPIPEEREKNLSYPAPKKNTLALNRPGNATGSGGT